MSRVQIDRAELSALVMRLDAAVRTIQRGNHKAGARAVAQVATDLSNLPDAPEGCA